MLVTVCLASLGIALVQSCMAPPPPPPPPATSAPPVAGDCKCGLNTLTKIVGGVDAGRGEFPWQVGLVRWRISFEDQYT